MKTVFNNREVVHVWASQQQNSGKSDNVFFEGRSIYSYGYHFEMARFIAPEVVFITTRGYSNTTAKHLNLVRQATRHLVTFTVPSFSDHAANLAYLIEQAKEKIEKAKRARSSWPIEYLLENFTTDQITQYASLFGLTLPELPSLTPELRQELTARLETYRAKEGSCYWCGGIHSRGFVCPFAPYYSFPLWLDTA